MSAHERRIQAAMTSSACRWREVERIGPFTATFATNGTHPAFNYAIPDEGATPTAEEVASLVAAYRSRGLLPRLEFVRSLAPAVAPALLSGGFEIEAGAPLMVLRRATAVRAPAGIDLVEATTAVDVRAAAGAQHEAYGEPDPPADDFVDGVLRSIASGGLLVLAREASTGEPAGGGQCTPPLGRASELTSIGVRPAYRRRGVAAAMTAWLAERMRSRADLVYLTAAGDAETRIYERVGFERIGEALFMFLRTG